MKQTDAELDYAASDLLKKSQRQYDVIIIGSGPGGYSAALRSAELGARVALIERDARPGGTCLNRGCIPTKALLTATQILAQASMGESLGIKIQTKGIDYQQLGTYQDKMVRGMTDGLSQLLAQRKIDLIRGEASICGDGLVSVTSPDGSTRRLTTCDTVLAMGSRPRPLPGIPFSTRVIDSDRALTLKPFPKRALIVGAGDVAIEFATIWNQAGSDVTMMIRHDRVLSHWGRRTGLIMTRELKRQGIHIITDAICRSVLDSDESDCLTVTYGSNKSQDHAEDRLETDLVLAAIGRDPQTDQDWMEGLGIDTDEAGQILTDSQGRTSRDRVWALGDITPGHHLAHRAFQQGITLAEAAAGLDPDPVKENTVPQVVYSTPQAASVGYTRQEAENDPTLNEVEETLYPMQANARMQMSASLGGLSLITACPSANLSIRIVVGIEIVSPQASENIAEVQQLVGNQIPLNQAAELIHPHPTFSETIGEALLKADGRPLNMR